MDSVAQVNKPANAIAQALACTVCGAAEIAHVVTLEDVCTVLIPFCNSCWEGIGGEAGYDKILADAIHLREQVRRN